MTPETARRLLDALNACREIKQFTTGEARQAFVANRGLQLVVQKLLEIVGEALNAAARSDRGMEQQIPNLHRFVDLRNRVIHGYDSVDYGILWNVTETYIPPLAETLVRLLQEAPDLGTEENGGET